MRKAVRSDADAVVFDLEDSVAPADKPAARDLVGRLVGELAGRAGCAVHVRINRLEGGGYDREEIAAVVAPGVAGLRLPKCESAREVIEAGHLLDEVEAAHELPASTVRLYPTIESAVGVMAAADIAKAHPRVAALVFGAADFGASIGVMAPDFEATFLARSTLVLASAAAGIGRPVDGAFLDITDLDGLRSVSRRVKNLGFAGKSAIHPGQIPVLHEVFTPSDAEIERARRILESVTGTTGVVDGAFVDPPVIAQAEAVMELARRIERD